MANEPTLSHYFNTFFRKAAQVFDDMAHAFCTVSYEHHEIHEGDAYFLHISDTLANSGVLALSITTPAVADPQKRCHLVYEFDVVGAAATFDIFEGGTVSNGEALVVATDIKNRERGSSKTSSCQSAAYTNQDTTTDLSSTGDSLFIDGPISVGDGQKDGGGDRGTHEFVLAPNTPYLFIITAGGTAAATLKLDWYEHTDSNTRWFSLSGN